MAHAAEQFIFCRDCFEPAGLSGLVEKAAGRLSGRRSYSQLLYSAAGVVGELSRDVTGNYEDNASFTGVCRRSRGVTAEERAARDARKLATVSGLKIFTLFRVGLLPDQAGGSPLLNDLVTTEPNEETRVGTDWLRRHRAEESRAGAA